MKRFYIFVACALLMLPASPAYAGTWSWHSDLVEYVITKIQNYGGGRTAQQPIAPVRPPAPKQPPKR